jgi:spore coat polysaccharide biosynthesis predicted glycosyltransferase SpsG
MVKKFFETNNLDFVSVAASPQKINAETHLKALDKFDTKITILDSYSIDDNYRLGLKNAGIMIVAIDDIYSHFSHADIVINHNLSSEISKYGNFKGTLLAGTQYALLRPEYGELKRKRRGKIPTIMVVMGGSDNKNQRSRVVKILDKMRWDFTITFVSGFYALEKGVVGSGNKKLDLSDKSGWSHKCRFIGRTDDFPSLVSDCDAAITAGGVTTMELAAVGIPFMIIMTDQLQLDNAKAWEKAGCAIFAGDADKLNNYDIKTAMTEFLSKQSKWSRMGNVGRRLVDGKGAARTAKKLDQLLAKEAKKKKG